MCKYITLAHQCKEWLVLFGDRRERCPHCKRTAGQLQRAGRAVVRRAPSEGIGGLTGRLGKGERETLS